MSEPEDESLASKLFKAAGKIVSGADTTRRRAALTFLSGQRREIPSHTPLQLAEQMAVWLRSKGEAVVEPGEGAVAVEFAENGLLGSTFVFLFVDEADGPATELARHRLAGQSKVALIALRWPPARLALEADCGVFLWQDGVRLGPRGSAADYVSLWLMAFLGFQFDGLGLAPEPHAPSKRPALFVGRSAELALLTRALGEPRRGPETPWIYSLTGLGGTGKSYLLKQLVQQFGERTLPASLDHQSCEDSRRGLYWGLVSILQNLSLGLQKSGCPCPRFDKEYARIIRAGADAETESGLAVPLRKILEAGKAKNPLLSAADAGWQVYETFSRELKEESEALATNSRIRRLTRALVEDLTRVVGRQRKSYYLFRRPFLAFDSYETIGIIVDTWLRTVLLHDEEFLALEPVLVVAGRHELLRANTRWSEFQLALRTVRLDCFSAEEADSYLQSLGVQDPERRQQCFELSGGAPLYLSLVANSSSDETAIKSLTERILEETDPEHRQVYLEASVPDGFNRDILTRLIGPDAFERVKNATFVSAEGGQWRYAGQVQTILRRCLMLESPERYRELQAQSL